jgi:WD40 repeat protein/energy-coupling factor transporter ATP-binding protein EcfA2
VQKRTAVLIDITDFASQAESEDDERDPHTPDPLPFRAQVDELASLLAEFKFDVARPRGARNGEFRAVELTTHVRDVIGKHAAGDVVVIYVMTHGRPLEQATSLVLHGADGEQGGAANVTEWLLHGLSRENGPHILFLLDVCYAGMAVDAQAALERTGNDRVWVLAASSAISPAYDARFTRAVSAVLVRMQNGDKELEARTDQQFFLLNLFAAEVAETVRNNGPEPQSVVGTRMPVNFDYADLPFFPNPRMTLAKAPDEIDIGLPILRGFDRREAGHFVRAAGCTGTRSDFAGRATQLRTLGEWASRGTQLLMIVTGRAGSGKSALLGALVGLTHPELSQHTRPLLAHVARGVRVVRDLAAVHARHRDVRGFVQSLGSQLFAETALRSPQALLARIRGRRDPVVVVVDALEEAAEPEAVWAEVLQPLLDSGRCRILVATRRGSATGAQLIAVPGAMVTDLDETHPETLRRDLQTFAETLLLHSEYHGTHTSARGGFSSAVASALTNPETRPGWGEFLIARLYVRHVIDHRLLLDDDAAAADLGAAVPTSFAEVFELDMAVRDDRAVALPVLAVIAHARGYGIPAELIPPLAELFGGPGTVAKPQDVATLLETLGTYLTIVPDVSGTALYQLFHTELVDYVKNHPGLLRESDADVYDVLVSTVAQADGVRNWADAPPYVRRHILEHARSDGQRAGLLCDPGYLLCPAPEPETAIRELLDHLGHPTSAAAALAVIDVNARLDAAMTPTARMTTLAVTATRAGSPALARRFAAQLGSSWLPVMTTPLFHSPAAPRVTSRSSALLSIDGSREMTSHSVAAGTETVLVTRAPERVVALATFRHGRRAELLVGCADGAARVLPQDSTGRPRLTLGGHHGQVRAVAVGRLCGAKVLLTADDGNLHLWDVDNGRQLKSFTWRDHGISDLTPTVLPDGNDGVIVLSRNWLSVFDLNREVSSRLFPLATGYCATGLMAGRPIAVHWAEDGTMKVVDINTRARLATQSGPAGAVRAATVVAATDPPVFLTGDQDGHLRAWSPESSKNTHWELATLDGPITAVASGPRGGRPLVAAATSRGTVGLWNFPEGKAFQTWSAAHAVHAFAFVEGETVTPPARRVRSFAVGPAFGGVVVAAGTGDGSLAIHAVSRVGSVSTRAVRVAGRELSTAAVRSRNGWAVVQATDDRGRVHLWHPVTGGSLDPHDVAAIEWPDSRPSREFFAVVASGRVWFRGHDDGTLVRQEQTEHGLDEQLVQAHAGPVTMVSGLCGEVVTFGADGVLRFWDFGSLARIGSLELPGAVDAFTVEPRFLVVETENEVTVFEREPEAEENGS